MPGTDLEAILAAALAGGARGPDGRGTDASDRVEPVPSGMVEARPEAGLPRRAEAPVWVRRLDQRIPVMPTIQTLPVDNEEVAQRPREPRRRKGGRIG